MKEFIVPKIHELELFTNVIYEKLSKQPLIHKVEKGPVLYVGDIHGYYQNVLDAIHLAKINEVKTMVFLGDYVDRGPQQLRALVNVLYGFSKTHGVVEKFDFIDDEFKEDLPFEIIALRGNHEKLEVNTYENFMHHLIEIFKNIFHEEDLLPILRVLRKMYSILPFMAKTTWGTIALHGGIPDLKGEMEASDLIKILKNEKTPSHEPIIFPLADSEGKEDEEKLRLIFGQLVWNDPNRKENYEIEEKFIPNIRGGTAKAFSEDALDEFLHNIDSRRIVRSHEAYPSNVLWGGKLINIFSAAPYLGYVKNSGYFLENEDGNGKLINKDNEVIEEIKVRNS